MFPQDAKAFGNSFAVFVLCFCSHVNTTKIASELKYSSKSKYSSKVKKNTMATIYAYIICGLSYFFVGICGYIGFADNIKDSILDNLGEYNYFFNPIVRVGYGLVVMFSYPILGYPATNTIDSWLFKSERTLLRRVVEAFIWVALTCFVCIKVPSLGTIFNVTGSTCGVLLVFVWPSLYFILMYNKERKKPVEMKSAWFKPKYYEYVISWIVFVVGIVVCFIATGLALG